MIRQCTVCGKKFKTKPCYLKRGKNHGKFCSRECVAKGKNNPNWKGGKQYKNICKGCGVEFDVLKCHKGVRKYCSSECRKRSRITPFRTSVRNSAKYLQWRSDVFQRDNWTCQTCAKRGYKLQAHHIISFERIMRDNKIKDMEQAMKCNILWDIENGVTLCEDCHKLTKRK